MRTSNSNKCIPMTNNTKVSNYIGMDTDETNNFFAMTAINFPFQFWKIKSMDFSKVKCCYLSIVACGKNLLLLIQRAQEMPPH